MTGITVHVAAVFLFWTCAVQLTVNADTAPANKLIIATLIETPYVSFKQGASNQTGNDRFEGFAIDLIRELADVANFTYELQHCPACTHGVKDDQGKWNGLIGEVVEKRADLALAALAVTSERESVVDFTTPFKFIGLSILFKKPLQSPTGEIRQSPISPIQSLEDLTRQTEIQYGMYGNGSTSSFFKNSRVNLYQKIWQHVSSHPDLLVNSFTEGVRRVREGNYAYIGESASFDYINNRLPCDTIKVGDPVITRGYAIATQTGSQWRERLSLGILRLEEQGILTILEHKWWAAGNECRNTVTGHAE